MGRHKKFTPDALRSAINRYFEDCDAKSVLVGKDKVLSHVPYSIAALCAFIDLNHDSWANYAADPDYADVLKMARLKIESDLIAGGLSNLYNPIMCIFILKCHYGYKDKTDVEISIAPRLNDSELNERIAALMLKAAAEKSILIDDGTVKKTDDALI